MKRPSGLVIRLSAAAVMISAVTAGTQEAFAQSVEAVQDFTIHQAWISPRVMGMGGAFTAVADDYGAIFYNPAGLARLTEGQINMGIQAMGDSEVSGFYGDVMDAIDSESIPEMARLLEENYGKHYGARATVGGLWARPKWGVAFIPVDFNVDLRIHQNVGPSLGVIGTQDTTLAYARGWDVKWFRSGRLSFGITAKAIYRGYYNQSFLAPELIMDDEIFRAEDANEGFTADADFGVLYTPRPKSKLMRFLRPTFGFAARNIADYGFSSNFHLLDENSGEPPRLQRRFDVGTVFELPDWWIWKTRFAADIRDMGHENWTFKKGSHVGAEFLWKVRSWWQGGWRVGLSQGYFTAGFTGKVGLFKLDLVSYAEEIGPSDAANASRRYMAKASLDW